MNPNPIVMTVKKEKPKADSPKKVFDVAKPGSLPPADATSRPVIVTNRTVMRDPMVVEQAAAPDNAAVASAPEVKPASKVVIKPLVEESATAIATTVKEPAPAITDTDADGVLEPAAPSDDSSQNSTTEQADAEPKPAEEAAAVEPDDGEMSGELKSKSPVDAELAAAAKAQDEIDTLVENKTYFLPINAAERRRSRNVFVFGLLFIVLLAAAWADIAMDAGFITIPHLQPLTHFFQR